MLHVEDPDIVQRDALQALDVPGGNVPVGRAGEDRLIQDRLGQFLVAGVAEAVFQVVDGLALDAVEVFLAEAGERTACIRSG